MARVTLDGVGRELAGRGILGDVSLGVGDGEFFGLIRRSGCGKTSLLRLIAGLDRPTRGTIWFDGEDVTSRKPVDRDVAMVFQDYHLYPHLTAAENIAFGLRRGRAEDDETRRRVR